MIPLSTKKTLQIHKERIENDKNNCTLCHHCLEICPASLSDVVNMNEFLFVLDSKNEPRGPLKRFILNCSQCGLCSDACPRGNRFDMMVRELKGRIREKPASYIAGTALKKQKLTFSENFQCKAKYFANKKQLKELMKYLDKIPPRTKILFYAGEHILLPTSHAQWELVKQYAPDAQIMGGLKLASGYDFLVQGDIKRASHQFDVLASALKRVDPKIVIVPSVAAFHAMSEVAYMHHKPFKIMTLTEWIQKQDIPFGKLPPIAIYHNPMMMKMCGMNLGELFVKSTRVTDVDKNGNCPTMEYNYDEDNHNLTLRHNIIAQAKENGECLVVDCAYTAEILKQAVTKENKIRIYDVASFIKKHVGDSND